jgi:hypothetical protein
MKCLDDLHPELNYPPVSLEEWRAVSSEWNNLLSMNSSKSDVQLVEILLPYSRDSPTQKLSYGVRVNLGSIRISSEHILHHRRRLRRRLQHHLSFYLMKISTE